MKKKTVLSAVILAPVLLAIFAGSAIFEKEQQRNLESELLAQLERAGCPLLGIVLNRVSAGGGKYYGKYYRKTYGKYDGKYYGDYYYGGK